MHLLISLIASGVAVSANAASFKDIQETRLAYRQLIGTNQLPAPLEAAAATQALADDRLPLTVATAQTQLIHETERLTAARERQAIACKHLELLQKSFDPGFLDLPTLLRTRSSAAATELDFTHQPLPVARARARPNQAQGVLP